jgi:hypothetical protein
MKKLLLGLAFAGAICTPPRLMAQHDENAQHQSNKTYYDAAHKDQHEWNNDENGRWNSYRNEHHIKQSNFARASKREQQDYWKYRHEHSNEH